RRRVAERSAGCEPLPARPRLIPGPRSGHHPLVLFTRTRTALAAALTLSACLLAWACESPGGGDSCFPPEHGPPGPSCDGFTVGLVCPVGISPWCNCTCNKPVAKGMPPAWVCVAPDGVSPCVPGAGGGGGAGGAGA